MNVNILIPTLMKGDRQNNDTDDTIIWKMEDPSEQTHDLSS
jgi:hypothetical protein